ncbi:FAD-dependent monooxygenase [Psychrobacter glacincola]|uniref:FAD-dependent monooxygenase n=1 Tax=Psychrobacter glacincola TaxID=56810 RepID=UPI0039B08EA2
MNQNNTDFDTDVIIIGGGPVGLTTACALAHHGVSFRLFEQHHKPKPHSRANNLWARPQELLDSIGIRDALAKKAYKIKRVNTLLNGRPTDPVEVSEVSSPYSEVLYSGQDVIEKTLSEQIESKGYQVERGRKLIDFTQDEHGVTVTLATLSEDGEEKDIPHEHLKCRYLIGADGSDGFVRQALDLDFEPEYLPNRMNRQVDAKLEWRRSTDADQLWFFYYEKGFCGVLPVWGGYHRLFFLADDTGIPDRDPTLEEMQSIAREVTEDSTLTLSDPIWLTHSRFSHGVSSHYTKERVIMVGDAGHVALPIGGQGMNAGLHDAVGIAWRLAMVLNDSAEPVILESYDTERCGEHQRLDEQQLQGFKNVVYRGRVKDTAMDVAARFIPNIGALIQGTDDLQQLSVAYPDSPLNEDHLGGILNPLKGNPPRSGDRAPDATVIATDGSSTSLFDHIYNPNGQSWGWSLLVFDGRQADILPKLNDAIDKVQSWPWIHPRLILGAALPDKKGPIALSDLDDVAHNAYGLQNTAALILVRPDGHIAFGSSIDDADKLEAYCSRLFKKP